MATAVDTLQENPNQSRGTPTLLGASEPGAPGGVFGQLLQFASAGADIYSQIAGNKTPGQQIAQQDKSSNPTSRNGDATGGIARNGGRRSAIVPRSGDKFLEHRRKWRFRPLHLFTRRGR